MPDETINEGSVVAFYGGELLSEQLEALYADLITWFDSLNAHPDRLGVHGGGFSEKASSFTVNNARLKRSGFSTAAGFDLYHLRAGGNIPLWDWLVAAHVSREKSTCIIGAFSSIAALPGEALLAISRAVITHIHPSYGIGFRRNMRLGPTLYAYGMVMGPFFGKERAKAERIAAWGREGIEKRTYEQGILRDVYPWNFLTAPQLNRKVGGVPLEDWIRASAGRGTLLEFCPGVQLWEVPDCDAAPIRAALDEAGDIFSVPKVAPSKPRVPESPEESLRSLLSHYGPYDPQKMEVLRGDGTVIPPNDVRKIIED
jgi:hypothetical protein